LLRYAQYIVGIHYEQGMITERDMEQARSYYLLSAQQEFPDSQTALGMALLQTGEHAQGVKWLEMAAQKVSAFPWREMIPTDTLY
jgi:TPR repeat protein